MTRHLYLHIPFCQRRCSYCDFNTYANLEDRIDGYVDAICTDIDRSFAGAGDWRRLPYAHRSDTVAEVDPEALTRQSLRPTVFLGGGTPTMLRVSQMERILASASKLVPLETAEITTEANPGTVIDEGYLRGLKSIGVNRISFGVQSFHDPTLRVLGRIHTAGEAVESYWQARRAGFDRINLDLIFGLPGQTPDQWSWTLDQVIDLDADHLSLYSLIVEENTPLHRQVATGLVTVPDDDVAGAMYELAMERLEAAGYVQYEISNWARPGSERGPLPGQASHHNVAYWLNADYLAFGAGAHGHVYPRRWHDLLGVDRYIAAVRAGEKPISEVIELSQTDLQGETMMMGLRLNAGVSYAHFRDRCGHDLLDVYGDVIAGLVAEGLLEQDCMGIRLSDRGRTVGNQVFVRFLD